MNNGGESQKDLPSEKKETAEQDVEGYGYCATNKQRCMQDCSGSALISTLN